MRYVIIGFGCAGYYGAKTVRENDPDAQITVISEHDYAPYNPMLTTYYVCGKIPFDGLFPFGNLDQISAKYGLDMMTDTRVASIDTEGKKVVCTDGREVEYDKLLIATGASAFVPAVEGLDPADVFSMRTIDDAIRLKETLEQEQHKKALVIGASMVGIKVVELLVKEGISTVFADVAERIFPMAAFPAVSAEIERRIQEKGVQLMFGRTLAKVSKDGDIFHCTMTDGSELDCDLIVFCIGTRTNLSCVDASIIKVGKGIVVDENMCSSVPDVYSAGDCCEGMELQSKKNMIIGLWANAAHQGITAGANMTGTAADYTGNFLHNITHFMGMDFIGYGDNRVRGEVIRSGDIHSGLYVEAVITENGLAAVNILDNYRISGAVKNYLYGVFENRMSDISSLQRGILIKEGLKPSFIEKMEGIDHGK